MNSLRRNYKRNIWVFHDIDNLPPRSKNNEEYYLDKLIRFVQVNGYVQQYRSFLSNPKYRGYQKELMEILSPLDLFPHRFIFRDEYYSSSSDMINEIDYIMMTSIFNLLKIGKIRREDIVIIVSGDSDFYPIVYYLQYNGIIVHILSEKDSTFEPMRHLRL